MPQHLRLRRHMLPLRPARRPRLRLHIRLAREVIQIPCLPLRRGRVLVAVRAHRAVARVCRGTVRG